MTKSRRKALTSEMLKRSHEILAKLCQKWNCKLIEFNGQEEYIHLPFQYYPQMDLSKFINIKSVSSRGLRSAQQSAESNCGSPSCNSFYPDFREIRK